MQQRSPESSTISFLIKNKLLIRKGEEREITHLLMNGFLGGKASVPDKMIKAFELAYGDDIQNGRDVFIIEQKSKVFKFHFDIDFGKQHSDTELEGIINTLAESVKHFLPDASKHDPINFIVCAVLDDQKRNRITSNLHIIFPKLYVNSEIALWIRSYAIAKLRKDHIEFDEEKSWDDIIDIAVLRQNGLRMVGSDKTRPCNECKGDKRQQQNCAACNRKGWKAENKIYWPWRVYPQTRAMKRILQNACHAASQCSTRLSFGTTPTEIVVPAGSPLASQLMKKRNRTGGNYYDDHEPKYEPRYYAFELSESHKENIRKLFPLVHSNYIDLQITKMLIKKLKTHINYLIHVRGFYDRFCMNKKAEHTTSRIYFSISTEGICQKCYCVKEELRSCGKCSEYFSKPVPLPTDLFQELFSECGGDHKKLQAGTQFDKRIRDDFINLETKSKHTTLAVPLLPFP